MEEESKLYKYVNSDTAILILKNQSLRFNSPNNFNDPFELKSKPVCNPSINDAIDNIPDTIAKICQGLPIANRNLIDKEILTIIRGIQSLPKHERSAALRDIGANKKIIRNGEDVDKQFADEFEKISSKEFLNKIKILCLSSRRNISPMWAYYADEHRGITLGFSKDHVKKGVDFSNAKKVNYTNEAPFTIDGNKFALYGINSINILKVIESIQLRKSEQWSHEQEYRIVKETNYSNPAHIDVKFNTKSLREIIIGERTPDIVIREIIGLAGNYPLAKIYKSKSTISGMEITNYDPTP